MKKYSQRQLKEAICFWSNQLKKLNEAEAELDDTPTDSANVETIDGIDYEEQTQEEANVQNIADIERDASDSASEYIENKTIHGQSVQNPHDYKWIEVGNFYAKPYDGNFYLINASDEEWFKQNVIKDTRIVVDKYLDELTDDDLYTYDDVTQEIYFDDYPPSEEPPVA